MKVAGEDLYHVDEELSPVVEEVDEEGWEGEGDEKEEEDGGQSPDYTQCVRLEKEALPS